MISACKLLKVKECRLVEYATLKHFFCMTAGLPLVFFSASLVPDGACHILLTHV